MGVMRGYLVEGKMRPAPDNSLWGRHFDSGDRCRVVRVGQELRLRFLGRRDRQVKIHGNRVELVEVERRMEEKAGHGADRCYAGLVDGRLIGFIRPAANCVGRVSLRGLVRRVEEGLRESLPPHMVPEEFHPIEEVPLNANGKVDRERLVEIAKTGRGVLPNRVGKAQTTDKGVPEQPSDLEDRVCQLFE